MVTQQNKTDALFITRATLLSVMDIDFLQSVEISRLIPEFTMSESITTNTINAVCTIIDNVGLLETLRVAGGLRGEERLIVEFVDPLGNQILYDFFIYKIDNVTPTKESDGLIYTAYMVSYQHFLASSNMLIRAFKGKKINELVKDLFDEFYKIDKGKELIIDEKITDNNIRGTYPKLTVSAAMEFLVRRSFSSERKSSSYRFFENTDSYFFMSDEGLEEYAAENNKVFDFTNVILPQDPAFFNERMNNLDTIANTKRFNTFDDMFEGYYRNKVLELNIHYKKFNVIEYDYQTRKNDYFGQGAGITTGILDRHTPEFVNRYFTFENAKTFHLVQDYMIEEEFQGASIHGNKHFSEMAGNRHAFRNHLNSITVEATGPIRLDVCAGSVVNLSVVEYKAANSGAAADKDNKRLTGKYIVKSVTRSMVADKSENQYILVKRDWNADAESLSVYGGGK